MWLILVGTAMAQVMGVQKETHGRIQGVPEGSRHTVLVGNIRRLQQGCSPGPCKKQLTSTHEVIAATLVLVLISEQPARKRLDSQLVKAVAQLSRPHA